MDTTLAELGESELKILNFFKLNEGHYFSKSEVVNSLGIYARTAERELKHLVDLKLLIRDGVGEVLFTVWLNDDGVLLFGEKRLLQ